MTITEPKATATLRGECTAGRGPDLSKYPLLAFVPGEGVRIASSGTGAVRVAIAAHLEIYSAVAARFGITAEEAEQAYRYYTTGGSGD